METYIGDGGFEKMTGTLFHEAAHQFVSLATNAAGWLNEGLASFFEGSRILANGTVEMNLPANHRLLPLARRMEAGWMSSATDGTNPDKPKVTPKTAPTFRIVLENEYEWGPPWYAPTWGVVYFLYNFQDPRDGRFVYRAALKEYIDASGGKTGETAIDAFVETVLQNPAKPTPGTESTLQLPKDLRELDGTWKEWILALRDEQLGRASPPRPYLDWAGFAVKRKAWDEALEHFEKGYAQAPDDARLLVAFGEFLEGRENTDRAIKVLRQAKSLLESDEGASSDLLARADKLLRKIDPKVFKLRELRTKLLADSREILQRYLDEGLHRRAMELSMRWATERNEPDLFSYYGQAVEREGASLAQWRLAYNEVDLEGWMGVNQQLFQPRGEILEAEFGDEESTRFDFRFLALDTVTSGDFSLEAEMRLKEGEIGFAGLTFGQKTTKDFHALLLYPPGEEKTGYADLASFYEGEAPDTWRHNPVEASGEPDPYGTWFRLRVDITGPEVDMWVDGQYVASQTFPSPEVLRGRFGLIMSEGRVEFRNVRFLARRARDRSGAIDRQVRLTAAMESGSSVDGSWQGRRPPFPEVQEWHGGEPTGWDEGLGYPQLLVLWEIAMNEQVRIDGWMRWVEETYGPLGLRVLSVVSPYDKAKIGAYLEEHDFPGPVGVDVPGENLGKTFTEYRIDKFFLPRCLLIDVDGRVAWEGAPGLAVGSTWRAGDGSTLDTPVADLFKRRRLRELSAWREAWAAKGSRALAEASFAEAAPLLREAGGFDARLYPDAAAAARELSKVRRALDALPDTVASFTAEGREPAVLALLDWAEVLELEVDFPKRDRKALERSPGAKDWKRALSAMKPLLRRLEAGKDVGDTSKALARLTEFQSAFARDLATELAAASTPEEKAAVVSGAEMAPVRWLARVHFGWSEGEGEGD